MNWFWDLVKAFLVGGVLCAAGQILIDKTKLTPARILTAYVVTGVILGAVGVYEPFAKWAGAGATVPLLGFGNVLAQGVKKAVAESGLLVPSPADSPPPPAASAPPCSSDSWWPWFASRETRAHENPVRLPLWGAKA